MEMVLKSNFSNRGLNITKKGVSMQHIHFSCSLGVSGNKAGGGSRPGCMVSPAKRKFDKSFRDPDRFMKAKAEQLICISAYCHLVGKQAVAEPKQSQ